MDRGRAGQDKTGSAGGQDDGIRFIGRGMAS